MKFKALYFLLSLLLLTSFSCQSSKNILKPSDVTESEMALSFQAIPEKPVVFKIQQHIFPAPEGGHIQGIQQLDKQHLVISGSSSKKAYFFIAKMKGITRVKRRGIIIKMVHINDDFPEMRHNHASGFQLEGNLLAIGTEGGSDTIKSSIVFYDLTNPEAPKPLGTKIDRQEDTAGAIGLTTVGNAFLLAVGGWDSDRVDFYKAAINTSPLDFKLFKTWRTENRNTNGWTDPNWGTYQSLNFIKDEAFNLHLTGFYQREDEAMVSDLYEVDLRQDATSMLKKIASKKLQTKEGASFKNGAGLSTLNLPKRFNLLATERNWNTLIRVNYW